MIVVRVGLLSIMEFDDCVLGKLLLVLRNGYDFLLSDFVSSIAQLIFKT